MTLESFVPIKWNRYAEMVHSLVSSASTSSQLRISVFMSSSLALSSEYVFYKVWLIKPGIYVYLLGVGGNVKGFAGEATRGGCSWGLI